MTSQIVCAYSAIASGSFTAGQLSTLMAAVPQDNDLLVLYGLRSISDVMSTVGKTVTRTITLSMNPTVAATATATLGGGESQGPVQLITVTANGADYVNVPRVTLDIPVPLEQGRQALAHAN